MPQQPDRLFASPHAQVADFAFNEDVVRVFPDMIKRSVPGYPTIVENLGVLAAQFQRGTHGVTLHCLLQFREAQHRHAERARGDDLLVRHRDLFQAEAWHAVKFFHRALQHH